MTDGERQTVEQAWRTATEAGLIQALNHPEDFPATVFAIVRAEADRRGLPTDPATIARLAEAAARDQWSARCLDFVKAVGRLPPAHPLMSACLLGVSDRLVGPLLLLILGPAASRLAWWVANGSCLVVYLFCLAWICWPLRNYFTVVIVALVAATCTLLIRLPDMFAVFRFGGWPSLLYGGVIPFAILLAGPMLLLSAGVFVRKRFWPVYGPHQCAHCGYDLRGLPEPRCPECGTPFVPATDEDQGPASGEA
jgi:hypothetical protein